MDKEDNAAAEGRGHTVKIELVCLNPKCRWRCVLGQKSVDEYVPAEREACPQCGGKLRAKWYAGVGEEQGGRQ
jgi:hypothetical protein